VRTARTGNAAAQDHRAAKRVEESERDRFRDRAMLRFAMMIVPGGGDRFEAVVSGDAGKRDHAPAVTGDHDRRRIRVRLRCGGLLEQRFIRGHARVGALRFDVRDAEHDPAPRSEREGIAAGAVVDEGVVLPIFVRT